MRTAGLASPVMRTFQSVLSRRGMMSFGAGFIKPDGFDLPGVRFSAGRIGGAIHQPAFNAASRQNNIENTRPMIAASGTANSRRAAKFSPHDDRHVAFQPAVI